MMEFISYVLRVHSAQQPFIEPQHYLEDCYIPIFALLYTLVGVTIIDV